MRALPALLLLLAAAAPTAAQGAECAPLDADGTLPLHCVDVRPRLDSSAVSRVERLLLRNAGRWMGFEGGFRLVFTVDTAGRAVRRSVQVLDADTGRFARRYPPIIASEIRYSPALSGGTPVPVRFEQRFEYRHAGTGNGDATIAPRPLRRTWTDEPWGSTLRLEWLPVAPAPLPPLPADSSRERQMEALAAAIANPQWDSLAFACVRFLAQHGPARATPAEVRRLRAVRPRVAAPGRCPETYDTGLATLNADGTLRRRPRGAGPDPYVVFVTSVVPWTEDWVVVGLTVHRSAGREILRCEQHRPPDSGWRTGCQTLSRSIL